MSCRLIPNRCAGVVRDGCGIPSRSSLTRAEELTRGREDGILRELTIAASAMSDSQSRPAPPPLLGGASGVALASADWADAIAGIFAKKAIGRIPRHLRKLRPGSRQQLKDIPSYYYNS